MSRITRLAALVAVPALALSGLFIAAGAASAGNGPGPCESTAPVTTAPVMGGNDHPCPTPSESTTPPVVEHHLRFRQQDIDLNIGSGQVNGFVLADGPIFSNGGTTQSINPWLDVVTASPGNTFNLHHEGLLGGVVDLRTCSITVDENDLPWFIFRGTGLYRHAIGFGHYTLRGVFSFRTYRGQCPELANVTIDPNRDLGEQLQADNLNPVFFDVAVQATGAVALFQRPPCDHADQVPGVVRSDAPALVQG